MTTETDTLESIRKNVNQFLNSLLEEGYLNDNLTGFDEKTKKNMEQLKQTTHEATGNKKRRRRRRQRLQ